MSVSLQNVDTGDEIIDGVQDSVGAYRSTIDAYPTRGGGERCEGARPVKREGGRSVLAYL